MTETTWTSADEQPDDVESTVRRYTLDEVASELGMGYRHVLTFARSGALTVGHDALVAEEDLHDFARRRRAAKQRVVEARATSAERALRMVDAGRRSLALAHALIPPTPDQQRPPPHTGGRGRRQSGPEQEGSPMAVSVEYGIFNDEGMLEGDCWSRDEAEARRTAYYAEYDEDDPRDDLTIEKVCPTCREGIDGECENCDEDED